MNVTVTVSRKVDVHAHRFLLHVQSSGSESAPPSVALTCSCGNGWNVPTITNGVAQDQTVALSTLLEMAAEEQERRHKDWTESNPTHWCNPVCKEGCGESGQGLCVCEVEPRSDCGVAEHRANAGEFATYGGQLKRQGKPAEKTVARHFGGNVPR